MNTILNKLLVTLILILKQGFKAEANFLWGDRARATLLFYYTIIKSYFSNIII